MHPVGTGCSNLQEDNSITEYLHQVMDEKYSIENEGTVTVKDDICVGIPEDMNAQAIHENQVEGDDNGSRAI